MWGKRFLNDSLSGNKRNIFWRFISQSWLKLDRYLIRRTSGEGRGEGVGISLFYMRVWMLKVKILEAGRQGTVGKPRGGAGCTLTPPFLLFLARGTVCTTGKAHRPWMKPRELQDTPGGEEGQRHCPCFPVPPGDTKPIQEPCSPHSFYFQCWLVRDLQNGMVPPCRIAWAKPLAACNPLRRAWVFTPRK